jgi:uncharacterized membrane protein
MKSLTAMTVGATALLSSSVLFAQNGNMMNGAGPGSGWMGGYGMGGYGGVLVPVLLVAVAVGLVVWIVNRTRNKEGN